MATFVPFNCFALDVGKGIHKFNVDVLKVYLTNVAPALTNTVYGTPADLPTAGGYTAGGLTIGSNTWAQLAGLASLTPGVGSVSFAATTGFGPLRYAVLYNFTAAGKNLIAYWDNGASISIGAAGAFEVTFNPQVFTLQFTG